VANVGQKLLGYAASWTPFEKYRGWGSAHYGIALVGLLQSPIRVDIRTYCCVLQSWSAAGALVDVPVAAQMTITNTTAGVRLPIRLSAVVGCGHGSASLAWKPVCGRGYL
jgi:hypothetical protein